MQAERPKKSWRDIDRAREGSFHGSEQRQRARRQEQRHEQTARANALAKKHRSALEALFSPKQPTSEQSETLAKIAPRIVLPPNPDADPKKQERQRLLAQLLAASGSYSISKAADELFEAGYSLPDDQEVYVQLLEHTDELRVREAIARLTYLLAGQLPKRRPVIEQRLRRIEDQADEQLTRDAAANLRRVLHGVAAPDGATEASVSPESREDADE